MNRRLIVTTIVSIILIVAALGVWAGTGFHAYTRYPSAELNTASPEGESLDNLFADTGLNEEHGEVQKVENKFALGLLPSGPGRDMFSVITLFAFAGIILAGLFIYERIQRKRRAAITSQENS